MKADEEPMGKVPKSTSCIKNYHFGEILGQLWDIVGQVGGTLSGNVEDMFGQCGDRLGHVGAM